MNQTLDDIDPRELGRQLKAARKARGLTQADVAEHLDVARTTVTAMEGGDRRVRAGEIAEMAMLYGRSIEELVGREEPAEPFPVQLRSTLPPDAWEDAGLQRHVFEFQRLCEDYAKLELIQEAPLSVEHTPSYPVDESAPERSAEDVANRERQRLGLGDAPILDLRQLLETDVGLRIFYMELPSRVAAMFAFSRQLGGCVAVNRRHPSERRRHSLAHELGHFMTDRYRAEVVVLSQYDRIPTRERFAEAFGRALLLPSTGVTRRFNELRRSRGGKVTPADLCILAHFFFVSVEALTRRVEELDLLPAGTWDRLKQQGFKVGEARAILDLPDRDETDRLLPTRYLYLAAEAYEEGDLSEGQLARFLRTDRVQARRLMAKLARKSHVSEEGQVSSENLDLAFPI